jgi:hypothetical protein
VKLKKSYDQPQAYLSLAAVDEQCIPFTRRIHRPLYVFPEPARAPLAGKILSHAALGAEDASFPRLKLADDVLTQGMKAPSVIASVVSPVHSQAGWTRCGAPNMAIVGNHADQSDNRRSPNSVCIQQTGGGIPLSIQPQPQTSSTDYNGDLVRSAQPAYVPQCNASRFLHALCPCSQPEEDLRLTSSMFPNENFQRGRDRLFNGLDRMINEDLVDAANALALFHYDILLGTVAS